MQLRELLDVVPVAVLQEKADVRDLGGWGTVRRARAGGAQERARTADPELRRHLLRPAFSAAGLRGFYIEVARAFLYYAG